MADQPVVAARFPAAAYLYVLHLDGPALAWEYLRRHPDYQADWRRRRRPAAARSWGLRLFEDPTRDARDAHPLWFPADPTILQLHPDADPMPNGPVFDLWRMPGRKGLIHDGLRLRMTVAWPGICLRLVLASGLAAAQAYVCAVRAASYRTCQAWIEALAQLDLDPPLAQTSPRPTAAQLLELHTLQALDVSLAGASLREVAGVVLGADTVATQWHADSALRARVRRLVRRGRELMGGGYRRLAQLPPLEQGRSAAPAQRP
ncbi:DNA -binding domain-containing protein [Salinisphaera sp. RV14]|uniref:DNA -binding domain-containing protein n=1 Tax=Salinisphaera sp. RV14 TaxID=3454140 RepID=UPI003F82AE9D